MNQDIFNTSSVFESKIRIQMLASLLVNSLTYNQLKQICNCSDGLMTTHTRKLIEEEFIIKKKNLKGQKKLTTYYITEKGKKEFINYINLLQSMIEGE